MLSLAVNWMIYRLYGYASGITISRCDNSSIKHDDLNKMRDLIKLKRSARAIIENNLQQNCAMYFTRGLLERKS
jgi:hypothetical protein